MDLDPGGRVPLRVVLDPIALPPDPGQERVMLQLGTTRLIMTAAAAHELGRLFSELTAPMGTLSTYLDADDISTLCLQAGNTLQIAGGTIQVSAW